MSPLRFKFRSLLLIPTLIFLTLCLSAANLFAASMTNDGPTPVRIGGKTKAGVFVGGVLQPGQTRPIYQPFLWIEHVSEGQNQEIVRIVIVEDSGAKGMITTVGGRYYASNKSDKAELISKNIGQPVRRLQPGYATNNGDARIFLVLTKDDGTERTEALMPGQTINIPEETVEVRLRPLHSDRGDERVEVPIMMPDGKRYELRSSNASAFISSPEE